MNTSKREAAFYQGRVYLAFNSFRIAVTNATVKHHQTVCKCKSEIVQSFFHQRENPISQGGTLEVPPPKTVRHLPARPGFCKPYQLYLENCRQGRLFGFCF